MDIETLLVNPLVMLPFSWLILGGLAFVCGYLTARKGHKKLAMAFAAIFAACTAAAGFAIALGWILRNQEVVEKWIGIIS